MLLVSRLPGLARVSRRTAMSSKSEHRGAFLRNRNVLLIFRTCSRARLALRSETKCHAKMMVRRAHGSRSGAAEPATGRRRLGFYAGIAAGVLAAGVAATAIIAGIGAATAQTSSPSPSSSTLPEGG